MAASRDQTRTDSNIITKSELNQNFIMRWALSLIRSSCDQDSTLNQFIFSFFFQFSPQSSHTVLLHFSYNYFTQRWYPLPESLQLLTGLYKDHWKITYQVLKAKKYRILFFLGNYNPGEFKVRTFKISTWKKMCYAKCFIALDWTSALSTLFFSWNWAASPPTQGEKSVASSHLGLTVIEITTLTEQLSPPPAFS